MRTLAPLILGVFSGLIAGILIGNAVAFPSCVLLSISIFATAVLIVVLVEYLPDWVKSAGSAIKFQLRKSRN